MNSLQDLQKLLDTVVHEIADREKFVQAMSNAGANVTGLKTSGGKHRAASPETLDSTASIDGADVDLGRAARCGFPEVVYAEGKPAELVVDVFRIQQDAGQPSLATRVSPEQATALMHAFPNAIHNAAGRTVRLCSATADERKGMESQPQVAVVTAGSCDLSVAAEAMETLAWMDVPAVLIEDVGVAGPQRILKHVPLLQKMSCIVCVAGMEAALPSVLGGHVSCPVIGVPTSVGYGASFGGLAALLSMLNSCSSNVVTVNIDAGFRGGYVAGMMAAGRTNPVAKPEG